MTTWMPSTKDYRKDYRRKDYWRRFPVAKEADQPGDIDGNIMQQFFDGAEPNSASQDRPDDIEAGDGAAASTSSCGCVLCWE